MSLFNLLKLIQSQMNYNIKFLRISQKVKSIFLLPINTIKVVKNMIRARSKEYPHGVIEFYGKKILILLFKLCIV